MSDSDKTPDQEIREPDSAPETPAAQPEQEPSRPVTQPVEPIAAVPTAASTAPPIEEMPPIPADPTPPMPVQTRASAAESPVPASASSAVPDEQQTAAKVMKIVQSMDVEEQIRRMSRRSFLTGALGIAAGYFGWRWLIGQPADNGIPRPFRRALEFDEGLARGYFQGYRLSPTFPKAQATEPRANGEEGLPDDFDPDTWKLQVMGLASGSATLTLEAIKALPRVEMVTELKCIEGWSTVVHWAGARFSDFIAKYPPLRTATMPDSKGPLPEYVALETPDGGYYVGLDMASAMHPQTLLCYEMNGAPLTAEHGAPLRLAIPVKYGIKNIKRIGLIRYTNERPKDFWAEQGYDWYAGH
jgi:hypothetical protein